VNTSPGLNLFSCAVEPSSLWVTLSLPTLKWQTH